MLCLCMSAESSFSCSSLVTSCVAMPFLWPSSMRLIVFGLSLSSGARLCRELCMLIQCTGKKSMERNCLYPNILLLMWLTSV